MYLNHKVNRRFKKLNLEFYQRLCRMNRATFVDAGWSIWNREIAIHPLSTCCSIRFPKVFRGRKVYIQDLHRMSSL